MHFYIHMLPLTPYSHTHLHSTPLCLETSEISNHLIATYSDTMLHHWDLCMPQQHLDTVTDAGVGIGVDEDEDSVVSTDAPALNNLHSQDFFTVHSTRDHFTSPWHGLTCTVSKPST